MLVFSRPADISAHLDSAPGASRGFVPTMGALHQGHLSLMRESLRNNDVTIVSIFVNPTQFNNADDLEKYPRTLISDIQQIESLDASIIIFTPNVDDMYHGVTKSESFEFGGLESQMEGKFRTGHFDGVATIVRKLFEIIKPDNAYFGEKDFQQLQIVRELVARYKIPVNIVGCPILREASGLAMSSRNQRLTPEQRNDAAVIYRSLNRVKENFGTETVNQAAESVRSAINSTPGFSLEYFEIADEATLRPATTVDNSKRYRAFIAVMAGNVRLIDTIALN